MTTIRSMIEFLEVMADLYGEDTPVAVYDEYTAAEGWDYTESDLWVDPQVVYRPSKGLVEISGFPDED